MTGPKQARAPAVADTAVEVSPAVQAIFDQLEVYKSEAPPIFAPVAPQLFTAAPTLFKESAGATKVFAQLAAKSKALFAPPSVQLGRGKSTDVFGRPRLKGKGPLPPRRMYVMPPPPTKPPIWRGWWLPLCEILNCYEDSGLYTDKLWSRTEGWDFDVAAEAQQWRCGEDSAYRVPTDDHEPNDEGCCQSDEHLLNPLEVKTFEETLTVCGCDAMFEASFEWSEVRPYMQEIRAIVLAAPGKYVGVPAMLDTIYRVAGYSPMEIYPLMHDLVTPIMQAVETGLHDWGLAAAYADCMARHFPRAFGALGREVDIRLKEIVQQGWLPESPAHNLVFEELREPVEYSTGYNGRKWAQLRGRYGVNRVQYHSGLTDDRLHSEGRYGWRTLWCVPVGDWAELHNDDEIVWGSEEGDYRPNGGSAC